MTRHRGRHGALSHGEEGAGHERWLVSYADFITLMFVVFTVLFSMANLDAAKYSALAGSLRNSFGPIGPTVSRLPTRGQPGQAVPILPGDEGTMPDLPDWPIHLIEPPPPPDEPIEERAPIPPAEVPPSSAEPSPEPSDPVAPPPPPPPDPPDPLSDLLTAFRGLPGNRSGIMSAVLQERGLVLTIAGSILFDPGETRLRPDARALLNEIAGTLLQTELPIMVRGTVDAQPLKGQTLSPWELAALRAGSVVMYLVGERGLPGSNFVTIGSVGDAEQSPDVTIVVMRQSDVR